ncbi:MAG: hypothetical protein ACTSR8_12090 [Promethearchaeota archaeon]
MIKFTPTKEISRYLTFLIIFLLGLLLFYRIIPLLYRGGVNIWVNISEMNGETGHFFLSTRVICEIIFMGPVFAIVYFFLMKYMINGIDENKGNNKYYIVLIEIGMLTFICISVMGHAIHMLFDKASWSYIYAHNNEMDTSELYSLIYYSDEWLGHHLIHIGYFGYVLMALITEFLGQEHRKLNWDELIYTIISGVGLSVVFGFATYEGQAAVMMVILCSTLLILEIVIILIKKINPIERPILLATLITNTIVICLFIFWITAFGMKLYYPYVYQPSEMR